MTSPVVVDQGASSTMQDEERGAGEPAKWQWWREDLPMTLDSSALKRLAAIQQSQGRVTLAEIGSVLPVSSMTPEEIGETMAQLEEAGIDIEVDKELLRHRLNSGLADAPPASHSRFGVPDAGRPITGHTDQGSLLPRATAPAPPKLSVGGSWWRPPARGSAVIILVLAVVCLLILVFVKR